MARPLSARSPSIFSESTRFFGQPRLTKATDLMSAAPFLGAGFDGTAFLGIGKCWNRREGATLGSKTRRARKGGRGATEKIGQDRGVPAAWGPSDGLRSAAAGAGMGELGNGRQLVDGL